jgi:ABC-type multidrug transport system fused ATPase/permease subunit
MKDFWRFARMMLHYRMLLVAAFAGAIFDAICLASGMGTMLAIFRQLTGDRTFRDMVADRLNDPKTQEFIGDQSYLVEWVPADPYWAFGLALGVVLILTILGSLGRVSHQYFSMTVIYRTVMRIRSKAFHRLLHLPMTIAVDASMADNLARLTGNTMQMSRGFSALLSKSIRNILQGLVFFAMALWVSWQLTGIFLVCAPVIGVMVGVFGRKIRKASKRAMVEMGKMTGAVQESLLSLKVVKVHQTEGYERRRFHRINRETYRQEMAARFIRAFSSPAVEVVAIIGVVGVAMVAAWYIYRSDTPPAPQTLVEVLVLLALAAGAFKPLSNLNNDLQEASAAAERVQEVMELPVEATVHHGNRTRGKRLPAHRQSVELRNVTFSYPNTSEPALREINLAVNYGSVCAIVGGNGSGKSTLVGLLPRLYDAQEGKVLIDGHDIGECSLRSVRRNMAMVTQETVLFEGTIAENLAYGARRPTVERIMEAARQAHAHEFISNLPQGYDTPIGERGQRLSGGQRQRIAIARAILRDPSILILDEATSQIDADSEAKINDALQQFMADRTTFVIAHRLSTVVNADMIVVMENGAIASIGKHDELLAKSDAYRVLCRTQLHAGDAEG